MAGGGSLLLLLLWQLIWIARAHMQRLRNQVIRELVDGTEQVARLAVKAVEQTYVLPAKKQFSTLETKRRQHAKKLVCRRIRTCLSIRGARVLEETFGRDLGDFLDSQVEAAFWEVERQGRPVTDPCVSKRKPQTFKSKFTAPLADESLLIRRQALDASEVSVG